MRKNSNNLTSWYSRTSLGIVFVCGVFFLAGCGEEPTITEVNFEEAEFAPFVEPDFPFITTSMDGRELGPGFPEDNISARVLAIRLGEEAAVAFDTDMLRWSVAWTGDLDRKSTRLNSSHVKISYAVFCLKKKNKE